MIHSRLVSVLLCSAGMLLPVPGLSQAASDYASPSSWLCLPGRSDACSSPLTATRFAAESGEMSKRTYPADPAAPIDCFYVYPTVSREASANADMALGPEQQHVAIEQFARFAAKCRTFAPLYRQITVAALSGEAAGGDSELAYHDIVAAWRVYLAQHNQGRGVVLIGHSQGASLLVRLLAEEVDGKQDQRRLVSAILLGTSVQVPTGHDVGGTFRHIPLCHQGAQLGCLIAYSSYLATPAPGPGAIFGAATGQGSINACVNPSVLTAGETLDAELPTVGDVATVLGTTFVENPGVITGACTTEGDHTFLGIAITKTDPRAQRLNRSLSALQNQRPGWGLHVLDVNLALGDLVEIVGREGQAWISQAH